MGMHVSWKYVSYKCKCHMPNVCDLAGLYLLSQVNSQL